MIQPSPQPERLADLLSCMVDSRLTEAQWSRLGDLLRDDERAQQDYLQCMHVHAMLQWRFNDAIEPSPPDAADGGVESADANDHCIDTVFAQLLDMELSAAHNQSLVDLTDQLRTQRSRQLKKTLFTVPDGQPKAAKDWYIYKSVFYGGIAAVLALLAALVWPDAPVAPSNLEGPALQTPVMVHAAVLRDAFNAQWRDPADPHQVLTFQPGQSLPLGAMHLTQGFVNIRFDNGAETTIEAPARFEIQAADAMRLTYGKLVGRCQTTESKGFVVQTPSARIIDLGTEFGVSADAKQTDVHVFQGEVSLALQADHDAGLYAGKIVTANMTYRVDPAGRMSAIDAAQVDFYRQMPKSAYELAVRRSRPLSWWRFDQATGRSVVSDHGQLGADASVIGRLDFASQPSPIQGEVETAAVIADVNSYLQLAAHPQLDLTADFTLEAWVYVPRDSNQKIMRILSNRGIGDDFGTGFSLGVNNIDHQQIGVSEPALMLTFFSVLDIYSTQPMPTDQWVHAAAVIDSQNQASLFINGQAVKAQTVWDPSHQSQSLQINASRSPMHIGRNAFVKIAHLGFEQWVGGLDEIAIYDRALNAQEIQQHHRAGVMSAPQR